MHSGKIVIVAPHPDDEVMGCGGLIQRMHGQGCDIHIFVLTGGEGSHRGCCKMAGEQIIDARRALCKGIDNSLGIDSEHLHMFSYPDGGIAYSHEETERLRFLLHWIKPDAVFVPHWGEGWPDHVNTRAIVKSILGKEIPLFEYSVWLWYYNVWRLDWKNMRVLRMTTEEQKRKLKAVDDYVTPKAPCGIPWSGVLPDIILQLARWNMEIFFVCR